MAIYARARTTVALVVLIASAAAKPCPQLQKQGTTSPQIQPKVASTTTNTQPSTNLCGNDQRIILDGTPWLVANSMYGAGSMVGTSCTYYDHIENSAGGNPRVIWSSTTSIQDIPSTDNICKGYANVGLIQNLGTTVSSISSIPAKYDWTRTSTTAFKGNVCFDFILGPKGDSTSPSAQELMLWLEWEGGQLPIGWDAGSVATINLFGTSWKLYEGVNTGNGMTVGGTVLTPRDEQHSMLPDTQFSGTFAGDLKDWFEALVKLGRFTDGAYVNVGNAG
ncbi:MAG: hypothetical protein Q9201_006310 [Fulgogasparrea decipioides]